jgi:tRNA (uracil-5-)-methyltransferase TRM9
MSLRENLIGYDSIAAQWDATRKTPWGEFDFAKHLFSAKSILDAGCGNGRLVDWLRSGGFAGKYLGVDASHELILKAKQNFPAEKFLHADLLSFISTEKFSAVFCIAVLHHLPDTASRLQVLQNLYANLKAGGELFLTTWNLWQPRYYRYILKSFFTGNYRNCYLPFFGKGNRFIHAFTANELIQLLEKAGFHSIQVFPANQGKRVRSWQARNLITLAKK